MKQKQVRLLQSQLSDCAQPGTIVADFQTLLDFIGLAGVPVGGKYRLFPMDEVQRLNARLSRPLSLQLERPQLRSYPNVEGLYLTLRASGMALIQGGGDKAHLTIDPAKLERWNALTFLERYLNLFAIWVLLSSDDMIGDRGRSALENLQWTWHGRRETVYKVPGNAYMANGIGRGINMFAMFGMLEITSGPSKRGQGWWPRKIVQTDFGEAFHAAIRQAIMANDMALILQRPPAKGPGAVEYLRRLWAELFPGWQQLLLSDDPPEIMDGTWLFKVSLPDAWRRLSVPCDLTLADFAPAICQAFSFDFDHLYAFTYRERTGAVVTVCDHREPNEDIPADEVLVGRLPIQAGDTVQFVYDFGDNWRFTIKAESLLPKTSKAIRVVKKEGQAPRQYEDWA